MKKNNRELFLLVLIVLIGVFLRLIWLDRIPTGISNDELDYILDAKAIYLSGHDLTGKWSPLSLTTPPDQFPKAELPAAILAPLIGPVNLSLFSARFPLVVFFMALIIFVYLISRDFFNQKAALMVALAVAINPWSIYFSRTVFSETMAIAFFFGAFWVLISQKGWWLLSAFPLLFLAFFSYIGTKLIFLPYVIIICFYSWFFVNQKKYTRQYLFLIALSVLIFSWFLVSLKTSMLGQRSAELLTPFHRLVSQTVDQERRLSLSGGLNRLFANKPVVFVKSIVQKYLRVFSTDFLFLHGGSRSTFSLWYHGPFYYTDVVVIALGVYYLLTRNKKIFFLFLILILLAPLPAVLSTVGEQYALRAGMLFPLLIILSGLGLYWLVFLSGGKTTRIILATLAFFVYGFQLLNFLNLYFFRNPVYNSEGFGFADRVLVRYLELAQSKPGQVVVLSPDEYVSFKNYIFYSRGLDRENLASVRRAIADRVFNPGEILFLHSAQKELANEDATLIYSADFNFENESSQRLSISRLGDAGEVYKIFNDRLCSDFELSAYPSKIKMSDFDLKNLPVRTFCQKFIQNTAHLTVAVD